MAKSEKFGNVYQTTITAGIDNDDTSITVATAPPTELGSGDWRGLLSAEGSNTSEIVTVTAVSGTTLTITRATEPYAGSSSASAHGSGATFTHVLTAAAVKNAHSGSGTSFPSSPSTNDRFIRTDRNIGYTYDGSQWVSDLFRDTGINDFAGAATGAATAGRWAIPGSAISYSDIYIVSIDIQSYAGALSGSAYWTFQALKGAAAESEVSLGSVNSSADTSSNWVSHTITVNALLTSGTYNHIRVSLSKTGSPGNSNCIVWIYYRLVG